MVVLTMTFAVWSSSSPEAARVIVSLPPIKSSHARRRASKGGSLYRMPARCRCPMLAKGDDAGGNGTRFSDMIFSLMLGANKLM
jgi:hypothetical protein